MILDVSSDSGSDFSEARRHALSSRQRLAQRGQSVSNTDEDEAELDEMLEGEAVSESSAPKTRVARGAPAKQKGKRRDADQSSDQLDVPGTEGEDQEQYTCKPGPLSKDQKFQAADIGKRYRVEIEELAREIRKPVRTVMAHAALTLQSSRGVNPACKFRTWYSHHHRIEEGGQSLRQIIPRRRDDSMSFSVSFEEYKAEMNRAYKDVQAMDPIERKQFLDDVIAWAAANESGAGGVRTAASRMYSARDQLTSVVRVISPCIPALWPHCYLSGCFTQQCGRH
jgi:hypothetical protein